MNLSNGMSLIFAFIVGSSFIYSNETPTPTWFEKRPTGHYYLYYPAQGVSVNNVQEARRFAIENAISDILLEQSSIIAERKSHRIKSSHSEIADNDISSRIINNTVKEINIQGKSKEFQGLIIEDTDWQEELRAGKKIITYWILLKIPKSKYSDIDINIEQGYGFSPVWRSTMVPGWGQFYKGESEKGWRFLISETALVSSFFISNYFSQNYSQKAEGERDYDRRKFYNDWSNRSYTIGTVSGILAGVIYCYNVFDAISARGAKKYAQTKIEPSLVYATIDEQQISMNIIINF